MLDDVQDRLAGVSPWLGLLDVVGGRSDEEVCTFCLSGARDLAWKSARRMAALPPTAAPGAVRDLDRVVALLALPIRRPTPMVAAALAVIRARETGDVERVARALT